MREPFIAPDLTGRMVNVAGFDFRLQRVADAQAESVERWGSCNKITHEIEYRTTWPSQQKFVDTLLHEILHAMFWAYDIQDDDKEERVVTALATAWMQVYRANPWLIDLIKEHLAASG